MKKIILPAILSLLVGGFANAQTTAKSAVKPASSVSTTHTPAAKSTVSKTNTQKASPATPATPAKPATAMRRKHKHAPKKAKK